MSQYKAIPALLRADNVFSNMKHRTLGVTLIIAAALIFISLVISLAVKSDYVERTIFMTAELDKEKTFDHTRKSFTLSFNLKVHQSDLFKFNDNTQELQEYFFYQLVEKKGDLDHVDEVILRSVFRNILKRKNINVRDVNVTIKPRSPSL